MVKIDTSGDSGCDPVPQQSVTMEKWCMFIKRIRCVLKREPLSYWGWEFIIAKNAKH